MHPVGSSTHKLNIRKILRFTTLHHTTPHYIYIHTQIIKGTRNSKIINITEELDTIMPLKLKKKS